MTWTHKITVTADGLEAFETALRDEVTAKAAAGVVPVQITYRAEIVFEQKDAAK